MKKFYDDNSQVKFKEDRGWFTAPGERGVVILLHGSHASPINNDLLAQQLWTSGYGVVSPLLAGHGLGTEYPTSSAEDLIDQVTECICKVKQQGHFCMVVGSSMGGTLALLSGSFATPPDLIVSVSGAMSGREIDHPWVQVLNRLKAILMSQIPLVTVPTLILHDIDDSSVSCEDAHLAMKHCGSEQKKCVLFCGSGHSLMFSSYVEQITKDIENFRDGIRCKKEVMLTFEGDASEVYLAGEFNNWKPTFRFVKRQDKFVLQTEIFEGIYPYKLVVDGQWILDPSAEVIMAPNGEKNSRLIV